MEFGPEAVSVAARAGTDGGAEKSRRFPRHQARRLATSIHTREFYTEAPSVSTLAQRTTFVRRDRSPTQRPLRSGRLAEAVELQTDVGRFDR